MTYTSDLETYLKESGISSSPASGIWRPIGTTTSRPTFPWAAKRCARRCSRRTTPQTARRSSLPDCLEPRRCARTERGSVKFRAKPETGASPALSAVNLIFQAPLNGEPSCSRRPAALSCFGCAARGRDMSHPHKKHPFRAGMEWTARQRRRAEHHTPRGALSKGPQPTSRRRASTSSRLTCIIAEKGIFSTWSSRSRALASSPSSCSSFARK